MTLEIPTAAFRVLLLPGWQNSGAAHWQSRWEALHAPHFYFQRVEQSDWMRPLRGDWMVQLEEAVLAAPGPVLLAAHNLGCMLTAAWAEHSRNTHRVHAALLVAQRQFGGRFIRHIANFGKQRLKHMLAEFESTTVTIRRFRR